MTQINEFHRRQEHNALASEGPNLFTPQLMKRHAIISAVVNQESFFQNLDVLKLFS